MQLIYRGTQYSAALASPSPSYAQQSVTYRGLTYTARATDIKTVPLALLQTLKYRGIVIGTPEVIYQPADRPAMA